MIKRTAVIFVLSVLATGFMSEPVSAWVFKGQPKEGGESYDTSSAERKSRLDRAKLLENCQRILSEAQRKNRVPTPKTAAAKRAMLHLGACGLLYGVAHQREKSIRSFEKALALARSMGDVADEATILRNLGIVQVLWGRLSSALEYYKRSALIAAAAGDAENESQTLNQMGQMYMFRGQYKKALETYRKSLRIRKKISDPKDQWLIMDNIGQLFEACGQFGEAIEYYRKGLEIKQRNGLTGGETASCILLGRAHQSRRRYKEALTFYRKGLEICKKHGYPTDNLIDLIGNLGLDMGLVKESEPFIKAAGFWLSLGRLYLIKSEYETAKPYYEKLLNWSKERRYADDLFVAHTGLGTVCEARHDNAAAAKHFRKAVELAEEIRAGLTPAERSEFFNVRMGGFYRTAPYEGLARVLLKMNRPLDAFKESEYIKARCFAENLSRRLERGGYDLPGDVLEKDANLNEELAAGLKQLQKAYRTNDTQGVRVLEPQVGEAKKRLSGHVAELRKRYPMFAATKYPLRVGLERMTLNEDEWVLAYDVTDRGVLIFLTKGRKLVRSALKPVSRKEVEQLIRRLRESVEVGSRAVDALKRLKSFDFDSAKKLAGLLVTDFLSELPKGAAVIVVPDESLGGLPFEMLVLSGKGEIRTDKPIPRTVGVKFFGDRNRVSYSQSITALTLSRTLGNRDAQEDRLLVIADPVFKTGDRRARNARGPNPTEKDALYYLEIMAAMKSEGRVVFDRLPLTGELATGLSRIFRGNSDSFTGLDASKENLFNKIAPGLDGYRAIVFATHGYFGSKIPGIMEPILALTMVPYGTDGFLRMSEVMGLKMNADIVALTACQSGVGRTVVGEGTIDMGRAFQYAGAKSVLVSLWSVAEESSVKLVESFFKHLREGGGKLEALEKARAEIRREGYDHPFFWAPFILVGEPN